MADKMSRLELAISELESLGENYNEVVSQLAFAFEAFDDDDDVDKDERYAEVGARFEEAWTMAEEAMAALKEWREKHIDDGSFVVAKKSKK